MNLLLHIVRIAIEMYLLYEVMILVEKSNEFQIYAEPSGAARLDSEYMLLPLFSLL